ncbi:PREDICTED: uncharacterized protein LOC106811603 [Priapulus caudatus]|uniref:Uncharacterized protein LOC106811603 n=1 Tax=Priapulus caudatus TaxID=37621 RepID=A0ABM1EF19_PRICU|nr:PREDICTED: uncharacterized protein LOC106811603 [Priapulus caudatus]
MFKNLVVATLAAIVIVDKQEDDVMQSDVAYAQQLELFLHSGRTGRRNAITSVDDDNASLSTAGLPAALDKLTCSEGDESAGNDAPTMSPQQTQPDTTKPNAGKPDQT